MPVPTSEVIRPGIDRELNRSPATRKCAAATVAIGTRAMRSSPMFTGRSSRPSVNRVFGMTSAMAPRMAPLAQCPRSEPRKRGQNNETSRRTNNATPNRIGTTTKVDTRLVQTARVRTAAEPHPRIAATSGVHGFMRPGRYNPDSG
jgi:hypothetical protein